MCDTKKDINCARMLLTPTVGVSAGEGEEEEERAEPVDKVRCVSCVLHKLPTTKKVR